VLITAQGPGNNRVGTVKTPLTLLSLIVQRDADMMLYFLLALVFASLVVAFYVRSGWAFSLPGLTLLVLIMWMLFGQ
jgi:hypothetical protein